MNPIGRNLLVLELSDSKYHIEFHGWKLTPFGEIFYLHTIPVSPTGGPKTRELGTLKKIVRYPPTVSIVPNFPTSR